MIIDSYKELWQFLIPGGCLKVVRISFKNEGAHLNEIFPWYQIFCLEKFKTLKNSKFKIIN